MRPGFWERISSFVRTKWLGMNSVNRKFRPNEMNEKSSEMRSLWAGDGEANQWRLGWRTPDAGVRYGKRKPADANEQQNAQVAGHSLHSPSLSTFYAKWPVSQTKVAYLTKSTTAANHFTATVIH